MYELDHYFSNGNFPLAALITVPLLWGIMDFFLWGRVKDYRDEIMADLPFWLDLHTTLLEGGMGFDEAMTRIYREG